MVQRGGEIFMRKKEGTEVKLLVNKGLFFNKGEIVTIVRYHNDFSGYEVKNKYGGTTYVYSEDLEAL